MTRFWRIWLDVWCLAVGAFGIVLIGGAFAATDGPARAVLAIINPAADLDFSPTLRFALALMGAVTLGWSITLGAAIRAADALGTAGAPVWRMVTWSVVGWYVIDSSLSVATGFALNAVSNSVLLAGYLLPVLRSGVLTSDRAIGGGTVRG